MAWAAAIAGMASQNESGGGGISGMVGAGTSLLYNELVTRPWAKKIAKEGAKEIRRAGREVASQQVVGYAKAGVRSDVGTPLEVAKATAARSELAALRYVFGIEKEMWETRLNNVLNLFMKTFPLTAPMKGIQFRQGQPQQQPGFSAADVFQQQYPKGTTNLYGTHGSAINLNPQMATSTYGGLA